MTDKPLPSDWAIEKALEDAAYSQGVGDIKMSPYGYRAIIALARRIEATDEPPVSIEEQAVKWAFDNCKDGWFNICLAAIEKYKELIHD